MLPDQVAARAGGTLIVPADVMEGSDENAGEWPRRPTVSEEVAPGPEDAWARRAVSGDRRAFEHLFGKLRPALHGILLTLVGPEFVDDLLQDVCLKALRSIGEVNEPARIAPWFCTIARNVGRDHLRRPRPRSVPPDELESRSTPWQEARAVLDVVLALPEAYREPLVLRLVEGLTGPEIAQRTGLTPGSVRVNLCRGMKLLTERLREEDAR